MFASTRKTTVGSMYNIPVKSMEWNVRVDQMKRISRKTQAVFSTGRRGGFFFSNHLGV